MAEFNWTVEDIEKAQRDFSNNFMRLDCISTKSYDVAIDCMTECAKKKAADVQPVDRWISVEDRLPEIGKSVLIYYPKWDGDEIQVAKLDLDGMMFDICGEFNIGTGAITHWMPLPEPPKQ